MASLLSTHLEQISLCASSIADLPFAGPKIFTNALLSTHDITSLIRDTEQHERALFHLAPPPLPPKMSATDFGASMSTAAFMTGSRRPVTQAPRQPRNKAVAAVLGGDLYQRTRKTEASGRAKGHIDVELLLQGAEKLAAVYPIPGTTEKVSQLRRRHQQLEANIAHYEARVSEQSQQIQAMNRPSSRTSHNGMTEDTLSADDDLAITMTREDLDQEEEEIKELERKKRGLEERVTGMERDLGGLMR